jgi:nitrogen fixation NifU-like protein
MAGVVSMPDWSLIGEMPWTSVALGAGAVFAVVGTWVWFEHRIDPHRGTIDNPDASAFVRGKCGDAMKISLRFARDRVVEAKYWTDGCRMSSACGAAAARLALNKVPEELADVDHLAIVQEVGDLAEEDRHCATLAAGALQEALRRYVIKPETLVANDPGLQGPGPNRPSREETELRET